MDARDSGRAGPGQRGSIGSSLSPYERRSRIVVLVIAVGLYAGILALRLRSDEPTELISALYVIPIALIGLEFGTVAALGGALLALLGVIVWDIARDPGLGALAYLLHAAAFLAVAAAAGRLAGGVRAARNVQRQLVESAPDAVVGVEQGGRIVLVNEQAERLFGYARDELLGEPIEILVPGDVRQEHPAYISGYFANPRMRPIQASQELGLRGRHRLGHEFPCEISLSALDTGRGMIALAAVRDVTERTRADEELRRAFRRLEAATDIARAIGGETELDAVLDAIVDRGRSLVEARGLVVMLTEGDGLVVAATAGNVDESIRGMHVALAGATAEAVESLEPQRVDVFGEAAGVPTGGRSPRGVEAAIVVPLEFRGSAVGVVAAFDRRDGPAFTEEDERLLLAFAASAATAVATARGVAEDRLRRTIEAAEEERKRWARELHDETLQGLGALRVSLASALRGGSEANLRRVVGAAVEQMAEEITGLRSLITELRPAALDELGLDAAIETLSERSASLIGLEMDTRVALEGGVDGSERLDAELERTIYRLVQEALSNVAKHARAERVRLRVIERDGQVEVLVADDGVGFDPEAPGSGFGLLGMRERVEMAGGEIWIESSPGRGATVRALLPARRNAEGTPPGLGTPGGETG